MLAGVKPSVHSHTTGKVTDFPEAKSVTFNTRPLNLQCKRSVEQDLTDIRDGIIYDTEPTIAGSTATRVIEITMKGYYLMPIGRWNYKNCLIMITDYIPNSTSCGIDELP
jgi:hypothetical protein